MNIEALASIFTIEDGMFKILLVKNKVEPYKGYWILPGGLVSKDKTVEETIEEKIEHFGLKNLNFELLYLYHQYVQIYLEIQYLII